MVVRFAFDEAAHTGSLACMKAVCIVLRNRIQSGWCQSWVDAIETRDGMAGNEDISPLQFDIGNRLFQLMLAQVDDLFYGSSEDETATVVGDCLYYHFIDRPIRAWFVENIIRDLENHPRRAHVGSIAFYA